VAGAKRGGEGGKEKNKLVPRVLSNPPYGAREGAPQGW